MQTEGSEEGVQTEGSEEGGGSADRAVRREEGGGRGSADRGQ